MQLTFFSLIFLKDFDHLLRAFCRLNPLIPSLLGATLVRRGHLLAFRLALVAVNRSGLFTTEPFPAGGALEGL